MTGDFDHNGLDEGPTVAPTTLPPTTVPPTTQPPTTVPPTTLPPTTVPPTTMPPTTVPPTTLPPTTLPPTTLPPTTTPPTTLPPTPPPTATPKLSSIPSFFYIIVIVLLLIIIFLLFTILRGRKQLPIQKSESTAGPQHPNPAPIHEPESISELKPVPEPVVQSGPILPPPVPALPRPEPVVVPPPVPEVNPLKEAYEAFSRLKTPDVDSFKFMPRSADYSYPLESND